jgi:hypothetical protein
MKVIFLDIDGVMNGSDEIVDLIKNHGKNGIEATFPTDAKCKLLKQLVDETEAKIVLSSTWRLHSSGLRDLKVTFEPHNLKLFDRTCHQVPASRFEGTKYSSIVPLQMYKYHEHSESVIGDRGAEIASWLLDHPDVESFVILDDEAYDICPWFPQNLVKTNTKIGLLEDHIKKAKEILNN